MTKEQPITLAPARSSSRMPAHGGAAGGDQIVDQQHMLALLHRVDVNFHPVLAVFQGIILADHGVGQLAFLADRHEADGQADAPPRRPG